MRKRTLLCFVLTALVAVGHGQTPTAPDGRIHSMTGIIKTHAVFESKILGNRRDVFVYLPPDYEKQSDARYPVLYMHDGQNVFDGFTSFIPNQEWRADEAAEALITAKLIEPLIIVAISNAGASRADEYLPTRWTSDPNKYPLMGGKADLYGKMITDELQPFINKTYRTKVGPENTGVCGSSLGGIVSLQLGLTRPDVFGKLGIFSPSLWWQDGLMIKNTQALPQKLPLKLWVSIGTKEGAGALPDVESFSDVLQKKGWLPGKDLAVYVDGYAEHNERTWANCFPAFLMFMYGRK